MPKRKRAFFETSLERRSAKRVLRSAIDFQRKNWFIPKKVNEDGINIAYGPRDGILYLPDTSDRTPLETLNLVFNNGLSNDTATALDFFPYLEEKFGEAPFFGAYFEKQLAMDDAEEYGYIYVVDASKANDLTCIPYSKFNIRNPKLMEGEGYSDYLGCRPFFLVMGNSILPQYIVGVFAVQYLAFSLNISENTLIINPNYSGDLVVIKNKLKISAVKALEDCVMQFLTYDTAASAYTSETHGLNRRFLYLRNALRRVCVEEGIAAIIDKLPNITRWLDTSPFRSDQLNYIGKVLICSKNAKTSILEAASAGLQFEQGFYEDNPIRSLPAEVRYKIYSHVYPRLQEKKSTANKVKHKFANEILSFRSSSFFAKICPTANKTSQTDSVEVENVLADEHPNKMTTSLV